MEGSEEREIEKDGGKGLKERGREGIDSPTPPSPPPAPPFTFLPSGLPEFKNHLPSRPPAGAPRASRGALQGPARSPGDGAQGTGSGDGGGWGEKEEVEFWNG